MKYGHELTPAEQLQPPTQVVPAEQIQALSAQDPARVGETERLLLTGAYEAADRKANAIQEQGGVANDIARTALGQVFTGAGIVGKQNSIAEGRLRGVAADGSPIFEKVDAQARRQAAWETRQTALAPAESEQPDFGPQPQTFQQARQAPIPQKPNAAPIRPSEQFDPYRDDMVEAHREQRTADLAARQRTMPTSAASRLDQQPKPVQEDDVFDDPLGNNRKQ
jgi:hypothetical protein